jgi:hypothetical protein
MNIEWCRCNRRILTSGQQEKNLPCELCQKEHAEGFKERVEKAAQNEEEK